MTSTNPSSDPVGERYWAYLLARAGVAAVVAIGITFSADHSVSVGWIALAVYAAIAGAVVTLASWRELQSVPRLLLGAQGVVLIAGASFAVVFAREGLGLYVPILVAVFLIAGAVELAVGIRSRGQTAVARDWIFLGATSMVFALAILLVPTDLSQPITVPGENVPNLTASVVVVGSLGAYAAIAAVYLVIAGLSLKWAKHPDPVVNTEGAS